MICRKLNLFSEAFVAIDGSKFKSVNCSDRNYTRAKLKRRLNRLMKVLINTWHKSSVQIGWKHRLQKTKQNVLKARSQN